MRIALPPVVFPLIDPVPAYFKLRPNEREISHGRLLCKHAEWINMAKPEQLRSRRGNDGYGS